MRVLFIAVFLLNMIWCTAQNPVLPSGSRPGQLPAPKPKMLAKPDLSITAISFVSLTRDGDFANVRISVTIKNSGGLTVPETKLRGENAWARDGRPAGWKRMTELLNVASIDPGKSVTAEYTYRVDGFTAAKKFAIRVFADAGSIVSESSESNNYSTNLIITPPAN